MRDFLRKSLSRDAHPVVQFIKYGMAGGLATAVDIGVFYTLSWLVLPALTANDQLVRLFGMEITPVTESARQWHYVVNRALTFLVSNLTAYVANVLWVFTPGRHSRVKEIALFYAVSGIAFSIATGVSYALIKWYACTTTTAFLVNLVCSLMINFVCRKYLVFKG